ncbi:hypothetical protein BHE74_00026802 [Ensete ventricosum]|uniref:Uncharacterized protein n=1 Tax=Ensete ventricosum TaxID=4639 RepID=A0A427ABF0_ENSVE|nr:hypothetical protein B296_00001514 [Ensete ventricosum]RWV80448.1 hypothetical protein GW17_00058283 [Ensete ventricosum]RWW65864.1 hypothetical protein BHE74_00026802 [Ensete ventricosum]RZR99868.1 hypothetical protein BHM03_00029493 [Ensete ventricosum]
MKPLLLLFSFLLLLPLPALGDCGCTRDAESHSTTKASHLKFVAVASILAAGAVGVLIPILGRAVSALRPENDMFFVIKAFAAGVILATGLIHILPAAFQSLTSPCLDEHPWQDFPVTGFVVMSSALGTMMIDSFATSYYERSHFRKARPVEEDDEAEQGSSGDHAHVDTHRSHGHAHASTAAATEEASLSERIRQQVISQVPLMMYAGSGAGNSGPFSDHWDLLGCLTKYMSSCLLTTLGTCHRMFPPTFPVAPQANFRTKSSIMMAVFFSLTAPIGIAVGTGISFVYNETSSTALIVEGVFNAASAGILVYMSLVDLLAADFTNPRMQSNGKLQLGAHLALLLGAGLMSLLAKWA